MPAPANLSNTLPIDAQYHLIPCLAAALPPCPIPTCHSQAIAMTPAGPNSAMRERRHLRATQLNPAPKTASRRSAPYFVSSHDPESYVTKTEISPRLPDPHACNPAQPPKAVSPYDPESRMSKTETPLRLPFRTPCPRPTPSKAKPSQSTIQNPTLRKMGLHRELPGLGTFAIRPTTCALTSHSMIQSPTQRKVRFLRDMIPATATTRARPAQRAEAASPEPRPSLSVHDPKSHTTKTETPPRRPQILG